MRRRPPGPPLPASRPQPAARSPLPARTMPPRPPWRTLSSLQPRHARSLAAPSTLHASTQRASTEARCSVQHRDSLKRLIFSLNFSTPPRPSQCAASALPPPAKSSFRHSARLLAGARLRRRRSALRGAAPLLAGEPPLLHDVKLLVDAAAAAVAPPSPGVVSILLLLGWIQFQLRVSQFQLRVSLLLCLGSVLFCAIKFVSKHGAVGAQNCEIISELLKAITRISKLPNPFHRTERQA